MIAGAVSNILLDWVFIFPLKMGITGAAIASGLGQVLACLILSAHFIRREGRLTVKMTQFDKSRAVQILKTGSPEFITQMNQPVTILCYNLIVMKIFGEIGVSAFPVVTYILIIAIGVFSGLAQGHIISIEPPPFNRQWLTKQQKREAMPGQALSLFFLERVSMTNKINFGNGLE